jgi:hypothetical protein
MKLAFIACIEAGNLENQALLLFRSIRKYGGRYSEAPIYSFQPRKGPPLNRQTYGVLSELVVEHINDVLNTQFDFYPIANKIFACARAEEMLREKILVFLDSDTIIVNEPKEFDLPDEMVAALRPVHNKNRGSTGPDDANEPYWEKLYEICGVKKAPFVKTVVTNREIRAYWNAGLIAVRRSGGLFKQWKRDFLRLMEAGHVPKGQITFMDQLSLAATLALAPEQVVTLDHRYNYPLPKRPILSEPLKSCQFEDLIHVHYHRWFNKPGFLSAIRPRLNSSSEIYKWIDSFLPFHPTIDDPLRF